MSNRLSKVLEKRKFCLLTSFKKDGARVSSPMWFVEKDEVVYITTRGQSWKVKRLHRDPRAEISWCNGSGNIHGKPVAAMVSVLTEGEEFEAARKLLSKKYGMQKKVVDLVLRFAKDKTEAILRVERVKGGAAPSETTPPASSAE